LKAGIFEKVKNDRFVLKSLAAVKANNVRTIDQFVIDKATSSMTSSAITDE
jgi:hypothetical protein